MPPFKRPLLAGALCFCLMLQTFLQPGAGAKEKERLELGIGLAAATLPHYRGSDEHENYLLPLPYFSYEGRRLKIDREGGQFYFLRTPRFLLNLSVGLTPPVDTRDNRARIGMPGLDPIFELGPRAEINLYRSHDALFEVRAGIPLRQAIVVDGDHLKEMGLIFSPYLQWIYNNDWKTSLSVGPIWASEAYHHYFYEVAPQHATSSRPRYDAHGGYSGFRATLFSSRRFDHTWLGMVARYDNLSGAVFEDSPLVKQKEAFVLGFFAARIFLNSVTERNGKNR